jgi:hypothetical protein
MKVIQLRKKRERMAPQQLAAVCQQLQRAPGDGVVAEVRLLVPEALPKLLSHPRHVKPRPCLRKNPPMM